MVEFIINSNQILAVCSFATAIWGVWKIVREIKKPSDNLKAVLNKHDRLLDSDNKRLQEVETSNKMILQCLLVIINHEITGNGFDKMKKARDELQEYLINR